MDATTTPPDTHQPDSCSSTGGSPLGDVLRRLRLRAGLTQAEAADQIGVSGSTVCQWERGNTSPRKHRLLAIADLYDVAVADIAPDLSTRPRRRLDDAPTFRAGVGHTWQAIPDDAWAVICDQARRRGGTPTELLRAFARGLAHGGQL